MHVGVPEEPVALPPDNNLKQLRFTPVQRLTKIPAGEITELSFDEVLEMFPEVASEEIACPQCGRGTEAMFWYQYGLQKGAIVDKGVFMSNTFAI
jgi:hypothetical protein